MRHARPIARDHAALAARPVSAARLVRCEDAAPSRAPVTHSYAALVFCTGGSARVEQDGLWALGPGEALLVPSGAAHRTVEEDGAERWALGFSVPCFLRGGSAALLEPFERVRAGGSAVVRIPSARHELLVTLLRELEAIGREPRGAREGIEGVEHSLLTLVLAEVRQAARAGGARLGAGGVVAEALRFIERHCLGRLTLADVAAAVGRSPAHVTTAVTRATGRSVGKWIVSGRLAEARRLLRSSDEPVERIAERVGYADATHFIRMFRREHGRTPAAWRAAQASAEGA